MMRKLLALFIITIIPVEVKANEDIRLYVLDCGRIIVRDVAMFDPDAPKGKKLELANSCYLIKHGDDLLMWDTGLPDSWVDVPTGMTRKWSGEGAFELFMDKTIESQLHEIGLEYKDINYVAFSHLHFDHTGNANKFKHATWLVQKSEYESANLQAKEGSRYRKIRFKDIETSKHKFLEGDYDVFGDKTVRLIATSGHSKGHQSLLITLPNSRMVVLLAGDVSMSMEYWDSRKLDILSENVDENKDSALRLQWISKEESAPIWFAHDKTQYESVKHSPEYYD